MLFSPVIERSEEGWRSLCDAARPGPKRRQSCLVMTRSKALHRYRRQRQSSLLEPQGGDAEAQLTYPMTGATKARPSSSPSSTRSSVPPGAVNAGIWGLVRRFRPSISDGIVPIRVCPLQIRTCCHVPRGLTAPVRARRPNFGTGRGDGDVDHAPILEGHDNQHVASRVVPEILYREVGLHHDYRLAA